MSEAAVPGVVVERTRTGFSAYSPEVPGCIATGATEEEVRERMEVALRLHREVVDARASQD